MFNFNFGLSLIDGFGDAESLAVLEQQIAALASVATAAAVNSPAVVDSPKNTAPSTAAVQAVVNQVTTAVAPVVAPNVPPAVVTKLEPIIAESVSTNRGVIISPAGSVPSASVTNSIASTISNTFKTDAQKDAELRAAIQETASKPTPTPTSTNLADSLAALQGSVSASKEAVIKAEENIKAAEEDKVAAAQAQIDAQSAQKAASVQTVKEVTYTGRGISNDPLMADGKAFTGNRNGIEYKNGVAVDATRADILQADREARMKAEAEARAKSNPAYDFKNRPTAPESDENYVYYYSWIGGVNTGEWTLYKAPNTPENRAKYGGRAVGGATNATGAADANNANTLQNQPKVGPDGTILNPGEGNTPPGSGTGGIPGAGGGGGTTGGTAGGTTGGITVGGTTGGTTGGVTPTGPGAAAPTFPTFPTTPTTTAPTTTTPTTTAPVFDINRQSAIKSLQDRFAKYGLSSLANKILELAQDGATEATITLQLQETPEYQQRFRANQERLKKGLTVLTPAEYLNLEDGYRQVLRAYGLRQFDNDAYVQQFISNDVSPSELSNRVVTAVQRVQNADPQIARTLRDYYGIGQNDLVAYVLDPEQQFQKIERQVAAAEIGTAARLQGIEAGVGTAEALAAQGITQAEARRGYSTIADILPTAEKLSQIYGGVEKGYGLAEAEQEVFNSLAEAQRRRQRLASREAAQFGGTSGMSRAGLTQPTRGQF